MALTSRDETDLLLPLFGSVDAASFNTFLDRLRRRSRSAWVGLTVQSARASCQHDFYACVDERDVDVASGLGEVPLLDPARRAAMRVGRVYAGEERVVESRTLVASHGRAMRQLGLVDDRTVRVLDEAEVSAWLTIARDEPCSASDSALLSTLVPYLAAAVRRLVQAERNTVVHTLNADTLERTGTGWIAFDAKGRMLDVARSTARVLQGIGGHELRIGQRLREFGSAVERELSDAAAHFAADPDATGRGIVLLPSPRIEAVLAGGGIGLPSAAAMVARCRHPRPLSQSEAEPFARVHALPRREAELAILIASGLSLEQAGRTLSLTLETTRNYSKRLFAKLGVRGQAELVRTVYESCAMLV